MPWEKSQRPRGLLGVEPAHYGTLECEREGDEAESRTTAKAGREIGLAVEGCKELLYHCRNPMRYIRRLVN